MPNNRDLRRRTTMHAYLTNDLAYVLTFIGLGAVVLAVLNILLPE